MCCYRVKVTLRDYTKIEVQSCQLVTRYGGKKFRWPHNIITTTTDDIVMVDRENHEIIILDKDINLIRTFGQGSDDCKFNKPVGVAVGHNVVAVSERDDHVVKEVYSPKRLFIKIWLPWQWRWSI